MLLSVAWRFCYIAICVRLNIENDFATSTRIGSSVKVKKSWLLFFLLCFFFIAIDIQYKKQHILLYTANVVYNKYMA